MSMRPEAAKLNILNLGQGGGLARQFCYTLEYLYTNYLRVRRCITGTVYRMDSNNQEPGRILTGPSRCNIIQGDMTLSKSTS